MEQQRISFETAKLAKEKGLDISCDEIYDHKGNLITVYADGYFVKDNRWYLAPPQSVLQTWLREEYDIVVLVELRYKTISSRHRISKHDGYDVCISKYQRDLTTDAYDSDTAYFNFKSYEDALEKGLQEALKLIE